MTVYFGEILKIFFFYFVFLSGAFLVAILASPVVFVMSLLQLPKIYSLIAGEIFSAIGYSYWFFFI